jgi:hypothetical protein
MTRNSASVEKYISVLECWVGEKEMYVAAMDKRKEEHGRKNGTHNLARN